MNTRKSTEVIGADPATVHEWMETGEALLVDVRETSEFDKEHIPGAMLLPLSSFDPEIFPKVPGKKIVLHCAVGKRSESAGKMLLAYGHSDVIHMSGGIEEWKKKGLETEIPYHPPLEGKAPEPVFLCPPPGEVLEKEYLRPLNISATNLATSIGVAHEIITGLIKADVPVTATLSLRLARYFSTAANFWLQLQTDHDLERARYSMGEEIRERIRPRVSV